MPREQRGLANEMSQGFIVGGARAERGSQGASRAAPGKSGLHARGEGERVLAC